MSLPKHGANPHRLYAELNQAMPDVINDFSENVNPFQLPEKVIKTWPALLEKVMAYPDPYGEPFLSAAAKFHRINPSHLFIGNGAAEILALLAERYRGKTAIIVHPTFSEYEATLHAKNVKIRRILMKEATDFQLPIGEIKEAMITADVLYLCTPNNPTGILPPKATLMELIAHAKTVQCEIVLDEAFIDFVDETLSFIPEVKANDHLIIVRSMTKMYAIPGIRLGYVVAGTSVIQTLQSFAPHWNINGVAAEIGAICLEGEDFVNRTKKHCESERQKFEAFLTEHRCVYTLSVANFVVFKLADEQKTKQLYEDLLRKGIVLRHTENFIGMDGHWLRVGIKTTAQMTFLRKALSQWFAEN